MAITPSKAKAAVSTRYELELDGVPLTFNSVSGITMSTTEANADTPSGDKNRFRTGVPTKQEPTDLTLTRQLDGDMSLWQWAWDVAIGLGTPKSGALVLYDYERKEIYRYTFIEAWPTKISVSGFDAAGKDIVNEELSITCYEFRRVK